MSSLTLLENLNIYNIYYQPIIKLLVVFPTIELHSQTLSLRQKKIIQRFDITH